MRWSIDANECIDVIKPLCAGGPVDFLPVIFTTTNQDAQTTVVIHCDTLASPKAVVHWLKDGNGLEDGPKYQISVNTSQLVIRDFNISSTDLDIYTCTAINPLGSKTSNITLLGMNGPERDRNTIYTSENRFRSLFLHSGPQISDSSIVLSDNRTEVTLKWEVPPTSVITGTNTQPNTCDLH